MSVKFTMVEKDLVWSAELLSLTCRARLLFQDLVCVGKAANKMGLFESEKSEPFGFHVRHVSGPINRGRFYEHIREFHAVGLIDVIPPGRPGLAQQIVLNGVYGKLVGERVHELCGGPGPGPEAVPGRDRPLKDSTLSKTNVNVAFNLLRPWKRRKAPEKAEERPRGYRDEQVEKDLRAIPARIEELASATLLSDYAKMKMAEQLKQRAWIGYRSRQASKESTGLDFRGVLDKVLELGRGTSPAGSEKWTPPAHRVRERMVWEIVEQTGDRKSLKNWWLLVGRMSETERAFGRLQRIVYDFLDELARKDPRAAAPDLPGAVLNRLLRDECRVLGVDLGARVAKSPT